MERLQLLTDWVRAKHEGQLIKKTNEPYFNHLLAVAEMAGPYANIGFEIGLCHDLLEKTSTNPAEVEEALLSFGYTANEAALVISRMAELTNVFTKTAYPNLSKTARKEQEASRLITISAEAQTVKYADLIDNINWMLKYDAGNAEAYLQRKKVLINNMKAGNVQLRHQALLLIDDSLETISLA